MSEQFPKESKSIERPSWQEVEDELGQAHLPPTPRLKTWLGYFIEALEKKLTKEILAQRLSKWMASNEDQIKKAVDLAAKRARESALAKEQDSSQQARESAVLKAETEARKKAKEDEEKHYGEIFAQTYEKPFSAAIHAKIAALPLSSIVERLWEKHPFLKVEFIETSPYENEKRFDTWSWGFLYPRVEQLLKTYERSNEWSTTLTWPKNKDLGNLTDSIEDFPFQNLRTLYLERSPAVSNIARTYNSSSLHRLDVYRWIINNELTGSSAVSSTVPLHVDEVDKLSPRQIGQFQNIIVNLKTESSPHWIWLSKTSKNTWVACVPSSVTLETLQGRLPHFLKTNAIALNTIDYSGNAALLNDLNFSEEAIWHAVLFGRVFPAHKNSKPINTYRNNVPADILFASYLPSVITSVRGDFWAKAFDQSMLAEALNKRAPFSDYSTDSFAVAFAYSYFHQQPNFLLEKNPDYFGKTSISDNILKKFEAGTFSVKLAQESKTTEEPEHTKSVKSYALTCSAINLNTLQQVHHLLLHHRNLNTLEMPGFYQPATSPTDPHLALFDHNTTLLTVIPIPTNNPLQGQEEQVFPFASRCAARNRFLHSILPADTWRKMQDFSQAKVAWQIAGQHLFDFYKNHGDSIDVDFIDKFLTHKSAWRQSAGAAKGYRHQDQPTTAEDLTHWRLAQVAAMGPKILDSFFKHLEDNYAKAWDPTIREPMANLSVPFDLEGDLTQPTTQYVNNLADKIKAHIAPQSGCPLFKSLAFILPPKPTREVYNSIFNLFATINIQQKNPDDALKEIILHNFDIQDTAACKEILIGLQRLANTEQEKSLQIMVNIPALDRTSDSSPNIAALKDQYKILQNKILDNQRRARIEAMTNAVSDIYRVAEKAESKEKSSDVRTQLQTALTPTLWNLEEKITYSVGNRTHSTQQQLQHEMTEEQQIAQTQQQQTEQEQVPEPVISDYPGAEGELITRATINNNQACKEFWRAIPSSQKELTKTTDQSLSQLFSIWVGSHLDAEYVINKLQLSAAKKMIENISQFRLGISSKNLPPGFYLARSKQDQSLILCFDALREKRELYNLKQLAKHEKNPFTVILHQPQPAQVFKGDYRQYATLSPEDPLQKIFWRYMAKKEPDVSFKGEHKESKGDTSSDPAECLRPLHEFMKSQSGIKQDVCNALCKSDSKSCFNEKNLSAFGQLLYQHEVLSLPAPTKNASYNFFFLAQKILDEFGDSALSIWKTRLVDPSENLCECLTKEEIAAVSSSILELRGRSKDSYRDSWWLLVDAHGKHTGHMRYASLWESYQKVLKYIDANKLSINLGSIKQYLSDTPHFNGQVFLERLHFVLRNAEKEFHKNAIRQNILNNIEKIDWTHSGFYYAARYEKYPFWDDSLLLSAFKETATTAVPSYAPVVNEKQLNADKDKPATLVNTASPIPAKFEQKTEDIKTAAPRITPAPRTTATATTTATTPLNPPVEEKKSIALTLTPQQKKLQYLRYFGLRMHPAPEKYTNFQKLLDSCFAPNRNPIHASAVSRLLLAAYAQGIDDISDLDFATREQQIEKLFTTVDLEHLVWFANLLDTQFDLRSGSLHLRFEDIALLFQSLSSTNQIEAVKTMSAPQAQKFINACGRALQCYKKASSDNQAKHFSMLLEAIKQNFEHPLLHVAPWLASQKTSGMDKRTFLEAERKGHPELALLDESLSSIDFSRSTHLPREEDLNAVTHLIVKDSTPTSRKNFVQAQIDEGCLIGFQHSKFRPLQLREKELFMRALENRFIFFPSENMNLCKILLENHLAIEASGAGKDEEINAFARILAKIETKAYYNELGQVLGFLIQKAGNRRYSLEQLSTWLAILDAKVVDQKHFPLDVLKEIVGDDIHSDLLNQDLDKLQASIQPNKETAIKSTLDTPVLDRYKHILAAIALHTTDKAFFESAKGALGKLQALQQDVRYAEISNPRWLEAAGTLINSLSKHDALKQHKNDLLTRISLSYSDVRLDTDNALRKLWQSSQLKFIQLVERLKDEPNHFALLLDLFVKKSYTCKDADINIILLQSLQDDKLEIRDPKLQSILLPLKAKLEGFDEFDLAQLALYCGAKASPSITLAELDNLIPKKEVKEEKTTRSSKDAKEEKVTPHPTADKIIHHYETVVRNTIPATKKIVDGEEIDIPAKQKRNYSLGESDFRDLTRILNGLKLKGGKQLKEDEKKKLLNLLYYANTYSLAANLASIPFNELKAQLIEARLALSSDQNKKDHLASARLLACMREILLRKYGAWTNHTQMFDLFFSALHNDESLLHQVKTGQGKSIITFMRSAYLAQHGYIVDVLSPKDSLSERDHKDFGSILDAMDIPNAYITPHSPGHSYKFKKENMGAVHYATPGNLCLFQAAQVWQRSQAITKYDQDHNIYKNIDLSPGNRIAFLDECDYILDEEQTQYNYAASADAGKTYNFEEWVYRSTYDFYLGLKDKIKASGTITNADLHALCTKLVTDSARAPSKSQFIHRFIIPTVENDPKAIRQRNTELFRLLLAAYDADSLADDRNFTPRADRLKLDQGATADIRCAKVVIDNDLKPGSTYGNLVQQMLHVKLNMLASECGQAPNYFSEPETQTALSTNVKYWLNTYYKKIEGCSGTIDHQKKAFNIENIIKMPTHEASQSELLPTLYCDDEEKQIEEIVAALLKKQEHQPILITCADDVQVKHLARQVKKKLSEKKQELRIYVDTNDSGKSENEMVPLAGKVGAITFSSRMGRGTNIDPENKAEGLFVIRTYAAKPSTYKQEIGRQGRNGVKGSYTEILNYKNIDEEYENILADSKWSKRLMQLTKEQDDHLEEKLKKHKNKIPRSDKWDWLEKADAKYKYIKTRSLAILKHEMKIGHEQYLRKKEYLIATLSGNVMQALHSKYDERYFDHDGLQNAWLECRVEIERLWNSRLDFKGDGSAKKPEDGEATYEEFLEKVVKLWHDLADKYPKELTRDLVAAPLVKSQEPSSSASTLTPVAESKQSNEQKKEVEHSTLPTHVASTHSHLDPPAIPNTSGEQDSDEFKTALSFYQNWLTEAEKARSEYGANYKGLDAFFNAILTARTKSLSFKNESKKETPTATSSRIDGVASTNPKQLLLDTLRHLKTPERYLVPAADLAFAINILSEHYRDPNYPIYLQHFHNLFNHFASNSPKDPGEDTFYARGNLLRAVSFVAASHYQQSTDGSGTNELLAELIKNAKHFNEHAANNLITLFEHPNAIKIFTRKEVRNDIAQLIELLGSRDLSVSNLSEYLKDENNANELLRNLSWVRPIFQIYLGGGSQFQSHYLSQTLTNDGQSRARLLIFLAKQRSLTKDDLDNFCKLLIDIDLSRAFKDRVFNILVAIPGNVPLNYIYRHSAPLMASANLRDAAAALTEITNAGKAFNDFLEKNPTKYPDSEKNLTKASDFTEGFSSKSPAENIALFTLLNDERFAKVPAALKLYIAQLWLSQTNINPLEVEKILQVVNDVNDLPKECQSKVIEDHAFLNSSAILNSFVSYGWKKENYSQSLHVLNELADWTRIIQPLKSDPSHDKLLLKLYEMHRSKVLSLDRVQNIVRLADRFKKLNLSGLVCSELDFVRRLTSDNKPQNDATILMYNGMLNVIEKMQLFASSRNLIEAFDKDWLKQMPYLSSSFSETWLARYTTFFDTSKPEDNISDTALESIKDVPFTWSAWYSWSSIDYQEDETTETQAAPETKTAPIISHDPMKGTNSTSSSPPDKKDLKHIKDPEDTAKFIQELKLDRYPSLQNSLHTVFRGKIHPDSAVQIRALFGNPAVAKVLSHDALKAHTQQLFASLDKDHELKNHAQNLCAYIVKNAEHLYRSPRLVPPIVKIILEDKGKLGSDLPAVSDIQFPSFENELPGDFWNFIANSSAVTSAEITRICDLCKTIGVEKLVTMPAGVSLQYINDQLTKSKDLNADLSLILSAAGELKIFVDNRLLIKNGCEEWVKIFNKQTPKNNYDLFSSLNAMGLKNIDLQIIKSISDKLENSEGEIDAKTIMQLFKTAVLIDSLPKNTKEKAAQKYIALLQSPDLNATIQFQYFVEFIQPLSFNITAEQFDGLYEYFNIKNADSAPKIETKSGPQPIQSHPIQKLDTKHTPVEQPKPWAAILIQELDALGITSSFAALSTTLSCYIEAFKNAENTPSKAVFDLLKNITAVGLKLGGPNFRDHLIKDFHKHLTNRSMNSKSIFQFYADFFKDADDPQLNMSPSKLDEYIKIATAGNSQTSPGLLQAFKIADTLKDEKSFLTIFGKLDQGRSDRILIMRHLKDFSEDLSKQCYSYYTSLIHSTFTMPISSGTLSARRESYINSFKNLSLILNEIQEIIAPSPESSAQKEHKKEHKCDYELQKFFTQKSTEYASFWFTSTQRKTVARELFRELAEHIDINDCFTYYQKMFESILAAQNNIRAYDRGYDDSWFSKQNTDGYSRLYDITIQLYTKVAYKCMTDPLLTMQQKNQLFIGLHEQFATQETELLKRLRGEEPYTEQYKTAKTQAEKIQVLQQFSSNGNFPKHLRYLVTNLLCMQNFMPPEAVPQVRPEEQKAAQAQKEQPKEHEEHKGDKKPKASPH